VAMKKPSIAKVGRRVLAGLLIAVAGYYAIWGGEYSEFDLFQLRQMEDEETAKLDATRVTVDSLRILAEQMERDSATIEQYARERFGMIREGETLYRFVTVDTAKTP